MRRFPRFPGPKGTAPPILGDLEQQGRKIDTMDCVSQRFGRNDIYHTHFDLDIAFIYARYQQGEDFPDHSPGRDANEARLKKYWQKRLSR